MKIMSNIIITPEQAGQRLDKFIREKYSEYSRAYIQKAIEAGQILVNDKKVSAHHFLKNDDEVEIKIKAPQEIIVKPNPEIKIIDLSQSPSPQPSPARGEGEKTIYILHEEKDFLVINKPSGLVVHQGDRHTEADTLVNGLLARYPEVGKIGNDLLRPGIVHRLDADASGVMVVARTQDMFDHLKSQFKIHKIKKEYVVMVHGQLSPPAGVIDFSLARKGAKMIALPKGGEGKEAWTEYETIAPHPIPLPNGERKGEGAASLLKIHTHTGRSHQIRVHLFAMGNPIVGDKLYGPKTREAETETSIKRLMLHAHKLGFYDLNNQWREYEAPIPEEFGNTMEIH